MKQVPARLGPIALLLTVIVICVSVLGLLTLTTARGDMSLAERQGESVKTRYELECKGQAFLKLITEEPEALTVLERDRDLVRWKTFTQDGMTLRIGLKVRGEDYEVVSWLFARDEWTPEEEMDGLWAGD